MKTAVLCLSLLFVCLPPCAAQKASGPFAEVTLGTAPYADIAALEKSGVAVDPGQETSLGRRVMRRYQFAALIAPLLIQLTAMPSRLASDPRTPLIASPSALAALQDLTQQFAPELARLGVNEEVAHTRLSALKQNALHPVTARPFSDVPKDHWAAVAVETLRQRGIVVGYPVAKPVQTP